MLRSRWIVAIVFLVCLTIWFLVPAFVYQIVGIGTGGMAPTLAIQDYVGVNKWVYLVSSPERGDIVMLRYPPEPRRVVIKRVIASGGDTLLIEDGLVYVNGKPVPEYAYTSDGMPDHSSLPQRVVMTGHYFVLGDNRSNSMDSRHWGEVPEDNVVGRISVRWLPTPGLIR